MLIGGQKAVSDQNRSEYYLVAANALPEIFIKVAKAKERLQTGESQTVAEAVSALGISRSAFYKYKDAITPFIDLKSGRIMTFTMMLKNKPGVLSAALTIFAGSGANILTINQNIPINGCAAVSVTAEVSSIRTTLEQLLEQLRELEGMVSADVLAG